MKKFKLLVLVLMVLLAVSVNGFAAEKTVIKLGHPVAANLESDVHVAALTFAEYVNNNEIDIS